MNTQDQQLTSNELQKRLQAATEENLQLRDKNERLFIKVGSLESRLGHLAGSNADLSCRLVQSEEEKLKISKELVEEKIQTNKMREQFEEETFELKNKILNLEGVTSELEVERDRFSRELQAAEARLKVGERSGQDLAGEFASLRNRHRALAEAHNKEVAQSEELSAELLALAQAQDALRRQLQEQRRDARAAAQGLHGELDRVRALISRVSHSRVQPEDLAALDREQKNMEQTLLGNQDEIRDALERMRSSYEEQQRKLEEKVAAMVKEHQENRGEVRNIRQELSERSAALMCSQSQLKEVEEENSQLQLQVKKLHEEYRSRLQCYLQDIADYSDRVGHGGRASEGATLRAFVDRMLQDVRSSYRAREEQLASAARSYKKRLQTMTRTHHALLIAYRVQREQILVRPDGGVSPGPPEGHFSLDPSELREETEKELQRLRQDKARLEAQVQAARQQVASWKAVGNLTFIRLESVEQEREHAWMDMRKQLKDATDATLADLEKERALLLTRATVAEAQVLELQDYVDAHLLRYKEEITHLRRLQGKEDAAGSRPRSAH
ncbi:coiled-coil domain-containing protein 78 [Betta splendens]|uniref:Coiled-coil domain-containing protein 78 n=1 Tax=Betta splendens TaxID=158456 RepID=A0A6P7L9I2_BETSP|nr:coiled-coil domain-containing protein 78 [Betta splendens]